MGDQLARALTMLAVLCGVALACQVELARRNIAGENDRLALPGGIVIGVLINVTLVLGAISLAHWLS